jgi:aromatic-L-amino-acid decarboxylase
MMNQEEFRKNAHQLVDWMADYFEEVEKYPVKSQAQPREIYNQIPESPPTKGESFDVVFKDFLEKIIPGITHWQHPSFLAYFPANNSYPSVLAEMLMATLGAQCMSWETSPAAAELEEKVMNWLKQMMGLPMDWAGVIQDTASTATLCALLTAREKYSDYQINREGFDTQRFRVYVSAETHSSIEKAVKIAGFGANNLVKISTDENFALRPEVLDKAIQTDIAAGYKPLCVVATIGTTSSTALDPLRPIGEICRQYDIFLHVDAAYAGTAALLPEKQAMLDGLELADSYLFNPHKWMFTNFDCTAYFVKDKEALLRTFEILPEYLKTTHDQQVNNYRDWGVPLGRRFRALKLWFVIRDFGLEGLQAKLREHLRLAEGFKNALEASPNFEILAPVSLNLVCFRWVSDPSRSLEELNADNEQLLKALNQTGKVYLTHTKLNGVYTLRAVFGQTYVGEQHVQQFFDLLMDMTERMG